MRCSFNVNLVVRSKTIGFEPSFKTFTDTLVTLLDSLYKAISGYPRVELKIYKNIPANMNKNLKVFINTILND